MKEIHGLSSLEMPPGTKLIHWGSGDVRRFVRLFRRTWDFLPASARDALIRHWIACGREVGTVEFCDYKNDLRRGPAGEANAQCGEYGCVFTYLAPIVDGLPDDDVRILIAHELAHGYLLTITPTHGNDYERAEREVAQLLVTSWGFPVEAESQLKVDVHLVRHGVNLRGTYGK